MRVVSLVPSWTETLIEAGVDVIGRTRFCIHPDDRVKGIPALGGTKATDVSKIRELKPDLVILDKEENTKQMAESLDMPIYATHVCSLDDCAHELATLSQILSCPKLQDLSARYGQCVAAPDLPKQTDWRQFPAVMSWWKKPQDKQDQFVYVIWQNPWMAAGPETFIGSVLKKLGWGSSQALSSEKYPKIELAGLDPRKTVLLFSSEPFPFARHENELKKLPFASALIDGESFSWFGIRALRFLEGQICAQA